MAIGYNNGVDYDIASVVLGENELKNEMSFKMDAFFDNACRMKAGRLIYIYNNEKAILNVYDIESGNSVEIEIPEDIGSVTHSPVYYEEENAVYIKGDVEYIFDVESSKSNKVETPKGWAGTVCFADNSVNGVIAVSDGKKILLADKNGKVTNSIGCTGAMPIGMTFAEGKLLVLYNDGSLDMYDKDKGDFIKKVDVSIYYSFNGDVGFEYDSDNNLLFIQMDMLTDVIDMESGIETAHVSNCFGYHKGKDIFVTDVKESDEVYKIGYYKRYSVKELIDKAHDILQDTELSDEMKSKYGIY